MTTTASATIRDAVLGDTESVAGLITELGYPTTPEAMRERLALILADPSYATFVADAGGRVVEAHGFYERRGYSRTGFRFVKQLQGSS